MYVCRAISSRQRCLDGIWFCVWVGVVCDSAVLFFLWPCLVTAYVTVALKLWNVHIYGEGTGIVANVCCVVLEGGGRGSLSVSRVIYYLWFRGIFFTSDTNNVQVFFCSTKQWSRRAKPASQHAVGPDQLAVKP